mgnify:CR=1 FL=1
MSKPLVSKNKFVRNVITLMVGTTVAQAIPIAVSPILTRIYSPDDFGVLALFISITSILGAIVNGRYELAIMLPKEDEEALNIVALGLLLASILSIVLLLVVFLFGQEISGLMGNALTSDWLYLVPVSVFLIGIFNVLKFYNTRKKHYKTIATASIYKSIVLVGTQLCFGLLKSGAAGLISGYFFSFVIVNLQLLKSFCLYKFKEAVSFKEIKRLARLYKDFPKYSMWAALANTLSVNLINVFIPILFSTATLGFYSLVERVLGVPSALLGGAVSQVFYREATTEMQQTGGAVNTFNNTVQKLVMIGLPVYLLLYLFVVDIFSIVFGEAWYVAGEYAKILIPLFFIRFVIGTVSIMNTVFLKNKNGLIFQMFLLISSVLTVTLSFYRNMSVEECLMLYTWVSIVVYLMFGLYLNSLKFGIAKL